MNWQPIETVPKGKRIWVWSRNDIHTAVIDKEYHRMGKRFVRVWTAHGGFPITKATHWCEITPPECN